MANKRAKQHHFVPKALQKAFCSSSDHIWYSSRDAQGIYGTIEDRSIESTFRIRDLYTVLDNNLALSDRLERQHYGKIDDYLGKMLPDVLSALNRGEAPTFSGNSLRSLQAVIYEMIKRTPDFFGDFDEVKIGREIVEDTIKNPHELTREELAELTRDLYDDARLRNYGRSVRAKSIASAPSSKILIELQHFVPRWMTTLGRHSFVLSSKVAYRIGNGGPNGFSNPEMEIWMPISPKFALVMLRDPHNRIPLLGSENVTHLRQVNEYAVKNSNHIASHSHKLLTSLVSSSGRPEKSPVQFSSRD